MSPGGRVSRYSDVSSALALRSYRQLGELVEQAQVLGSGIGGTSVVLDVDGVLVFAKRVPLTDLERRGDNVMSTANLFGCRRFASTESARRASVRGVSLWPTP